MQTLTQPTLLLKPFAESGDKNTLPDVNTDLTNPQRADLTDGFPQITSLPPANGGLPPERKDFNALGYLTTTYDFFYQAGGTFTFSPTISTAIGGYPLNARLWYTNSSGQSMILRSTVQNNTDNFNDGNETGIGITWVVESFIGVGLNEGYVSNCITKIPQDINLTLSSGTLTLKAGSILTGPEGTRLQTTADKAYSVSSTMADGQYAIFASRTSGNIQGPTKLANILSGTTSNRPAWSSDIQGTVYYDTTTSYICLAGASSWNDNWGVALPLCIVTITNNVITSIDTVFNGCGYIGKSMFVLPGLTGLAPNGFNSDGTLASYSITISALAFYNNVESNVTNSFIVRAQSGGLGRGYWIEAETIAPYGRTYIPSKNRVYTSNGNEQSCFRVCRYSTNNDVITDFEIMPVVRMAKQEDLDKKQDIATALNYDRISNCITGIPQDINLTLSSGTLTLKSGSTLTSGDGTQTQTTQDTTWSNFGTLSDGKYFIFSDSNGNFGTPRLVSLVSSGSSLPQTASNDELFFNTTDLKLYRHSTGSWSVWKVVLPLGIVNYSNGVATLDQVFNCVGYIGHHAFVLPGISFLMGNGKNADGTLASTSFTLTALNIIEMDTMRKVIDIQSSSTVERSTGWYVVKTYNDLLSYGDVTISKQYVIDDNMVYAWNGGGTAISSITRTLLVRFNYDGSSVTRFDIEKPIRLDDKASIGENNDFLGINTVPTPATTDNSKQIANTEFVKAAISANGATPRDVTTLWSDPSGQGSGTMNLSEPFTNFEKIGVYFGKDNLQGVTVYVQDTYWLNRILTNSSHDVMIATLGDASWSIKNYSASTPSTTTKFVAGHESGVLFYIYGINRISS